MAFTISVNETDIGVPVNNAYARIDLLKISKEHSLITVFYYMNQDARNADASRIGQKSFFPDFSELNNGSNPFEMGYNWLKTQPEFADATDS